MTKLEKVIKGLECHLNVLVRSEHALAENGVVMSSWQDRAKRIDAIHEAIVFLKAQEPRLVTEADFENADEAGFIPAWCEEKDTGEVYCECISIGALEDAKFGHVRWWTFRPTDAQREATPWN